MVWCVPVYAYESVVCDMYTFYTLVPSMHTFLEGTCTGGQEGGQTHPFFNRSVLIRIDCTIVIGRHHQRRQFDHPRVTLHCQQTFQAQHQAAALSQLCSS